jgi:hypothetical protein
MSIKGVHFRLGWWESSSRPEDQPATQALQIVTKRQISKDICARFPSMSRIVRRFEGNEGAKK